MRTLAERVEKDGPFSARDAVKLAVRLAKTLESLHGAGQIHGCIHPGAIVLAGARSTTARLKRAAAVAADEGYRLPQHASGGAPSRDDDAYAVALLLFFLLTGVGPDAREASGKLPPLAVFDVGDDDLDDVLTAALSPAIADLHDIAAFRRELERWLDDADGSDLDAMPWDDAEAAPVRASALDLSSLPPPPEPETPIASGSVRLVDDDDDRATLPGESLAPAAPRPPRLVPPNLTRLKKEKPSLPAPAPPPSFDHSQTSPPPPESKRDGAWSLGKSVGVVGVIAAVVTAGFFLVRARDRGAAGADVPAASSSAGQPASSTSAQPDPPSPIETSNARASATVPPPPSSTAPAASGSVPLPPPVPASPDEATCVTSALAPDAFTTTSYQPLVCAEADVVKGAAALRTQIVKGGDGRPVTDAMKEWALLGFYELAAYATIRDRCCASPAPTVAPESPAICKSSMQEGVLEVARSSKVDDKSLDRAIKALDKTIRCIARANQSNVFGGHPKPSGGEGTALKRIIARLPK